MQKFNTEMLLEKPEGQPGSGRQPRDFTVESCDSLKDWKDREWVWPAGHYAGVEMKGKLPYFCRNHEWTGFVTENEGMEKMAFISGGASTKVGQKHKGIFHLSHSLVFCQSTPLIEQRMMGNVVFRISFMRYRVGATK